MAVKTNYKKIYKNKNASIVGFGRFGKTLYKLIEKDFKNIYIYDKNSKNIDKNKLRKNTETIKNIKNIYDHADIVFFCVPIRNFKSVIQKHKKYIKKHHIIIDTLSVKTYPYKILKDIKSNPQTILTHPMFGPDSSKEGFEGLSIVLYNLNANADNYKNFKKYLKSKKLKTIELNPKEHDKLAAYSQGITHFIGRLLEKMRFKPTLIDTKGAKKLYEIMKQTCNDSYVLFTDLQTYNPYTQKMRLNLEKSYNSVIKNIFTKKQKQKIIFGIQGGIGSFNEEAVLYYIKKHNIKNYEIKYLYTSDKVLQYLSERKIDYGQFAIHNSQGGIVEESVIAMSKYKFNIKEEFYIVISHHLMVKKGTHKKDIKQIIAHPQVFKQCRNNISKKYKNIELISGKGDMLDTALMAKKLHQGKLPSYSAILGPKNLASIYDLDIIDENLQDIKDNKTYFLMVSI